MAHKLLPPTVEIDLISELIERAVWRKRWRRKGGVLKVVPQFGCSIVRLPRRYSASTAIHFGLLRIVSLSLSCFCHFVASLSLRAGVGFVYVLF